MNSYIQGATVRLKAEFRSPSGTLSNPTTVTVKVEHPSGSEDTYTDAVLDSTGKYHRDILAPDVGVWRYRWESTGTVQQVGEGEFLISRSAFV